MRFPNSNFASAALIVLGQSIPFSAHAAAPILQTNGPVIHLADNLDEEASLGWCIDTEGRGKSDQLHAHSCKPEGDDVLFTYAAETGMIASATYDGLCMAYSDPENAENPFGLFSCDKADPAQQFVYDDASMEMRLGSDPAQCVTVAEKIDEAGPYQSRDLILAPCGALEASFKQWVIHE